MSRTRDRARSSTAAAMLSAGLVLFTTPSLAADDPNTAAANLKQVREQIEREEQHLSELQKNETKLQQSAEKLANDVAAASEKKKVLADAIDQLRDEADHVTRAMSNAKDGIRDRQAGLKTRIVAIYKTKRRTAALDYLFSARSSTDLLKRTRYLAAIAEYDRTYLQGLSKLVGSLEKDQQRLDEIQREKAENLKKVDALEQELTKKREEKAALLDEAKDKIRQEEKSLEKLRASAEKFEKVLASIMGGDRYQPPPEDAVPKATPEVITEVPQNTSPVIASPFDGRGLESLKGKLVFPVQGEVIQRFGKQKHEEFADMLFVKGLEVHSPVGSRVRAVAPGKIVLSQVLPGYGNVIIVDHGQRYYTLYGRLASSLKSVGDVIQAGDNIAVLGEADYKGRNFYFELRVKGKATNPLDYFKNGVPLAKS
ncbi:MAG: peptidoglycan DD-metalloendopeptidase family protein [Bdellovibrionota bacterium]